MAYVKFASGVIRKWDDKISVGALITTYNDGYHILERIEFRSPVDGQNRHWTSLQEVIEHDTDEKYPPMFHYVKVLKSDGTKSKALKGQCEASYCKQVTLAETLIEMDKAKDEATNKFFAIKQFL
jgi:hypothetical protein